MLQRLNVPARLHVLPAEWTGVGLALMSAAASATVGVWAKLGAASGMGTTTMLGWRFGLLALLLTALGYARVRREQVPALAFMGLLHVGSALAYFTALEHISASTTALLVYCAPAVVIALGLLVRIRPSRWQVAALILTLLGLLVVVGRPSPADASTTGLLLGAVAGTLFGGYFFASYRLTRGIAPLTVTTHVALVTASVVSALGLWQGELAVPTGQDQWTVILGLALIPSLLAMPALYGAVQRIGATRTSMLTTTDPLWAIALAVLLLGESLGFGQLLGGGLILLGAALAQRESKPAHRRVRRGKYWSSP
ncbi:DMT family transporter [Deinococcus radiophilus]|uniref:DMT family transporter n=1 Tax=Deinococcus radiophilus TaxID=32062 RepID=A0A431VXH9_9DEIO|nr:DMT family transporter [Deinococcus radiophilus]RTR27992.1 DMT family transporter [Deinococcus radiophilus]UFA51563.1 DMT family transporter [Deinococcus radiophilus]